MIVRNLYILNHADADTMWMEIIAVFLSLFVLYRYKLQLSGWYKGNSKEKLPKTVSLALILISFILLITPLLISFAKS